MKWIETPMQVLAESAVLLLWILSKANFRLKVYSHFNYSKLKNSYEETELIFVS